MRIRTCTGTLALALIALPAWAQQGPFANVTANAECTVVTDDSTDLLVSALLEQKTKPGPGIYEVGRVSFFLEQKISGNPKFMRVDGSFVEEPISDSFPEVAAGDDVEVATHLYQDVCSLSIDPAANAIRAVVEVEVLNANPNRPAGLIHTGRCVSVPNPCR